MLLSTAINTREPHRVEVTGQTYELTGLIGNAPVRGVYVAGNEANDNQLPQGFLVQQPPHSVTRPHFHATNQFQVFVGGSGRFGKRPVDSLVVQYASGHTPYGPIIAGADGVQYFTLRQRWDPGAKYMPQMRALLERGRQRQRLVVVKDIDSSPTLAPGPIASITALLAPEVDGLAALLIRVPGGQQFQLDDAATGGGQYHVVLHGALVHGGEQLSQHSCQFATPDEGQVMIQAGTQGVTLLLLRFGRPAVDAPRHGTTTMPQRHH